MRFPINIDQNQPIKTYFKKSNHYQFFMYFQITKTNYLNVISTKLISIFLIDK